MYTFHSKQKQPQQQQKQQHYVVSTSGRGRLTNMEFNKKTGESYGLNGSGGSSSNSNHTECASTNQSMAFGGTRRKPSVGSGSDDLSCEDYEEVKPDIKVSSHLLDHGYGYGVTPQYHQQQPQQTQQQQQQPSHHHHSSSSTSSNSHNSSSQQNSSHSWHHSPTASGSGSTSSSRNSTATTPTHHHHAKQTTPNRTAGLHHQHKSASGDPQITNYFKVSLRFPLEGLVADSDETISYYSEIHSTDWSRKALGLPMYLQKYIQKLLQGFHQNMLHVFFFQQGNFLSLFTIRLSKSPCLQS